MPRGDGTGPRGFGRMTGRGVGCCAGVAAQGYGNLAEYGFGFGRGNGYRRNFYATGVPGWTRYGGMAYTGSNEAVFDDKEFLSKQSEFLENQLQQIRNRLSQIKDDAE